MWHQKTSTGKVQYFERYTDPRTGKRKTVSVTLPNATRTTAKLAENLLGERVRALTLSPATSSGLTFKALTEAYNASQRILQKASTAQTTEYKMKTLYELLGSDTLVTTLTAPYVRKRLSMPRADEEVTAVTFNERLKYFKALMRWAYEEELVQNISYLEKLKKRPETRQQEKAKYMEGDELRAVLGAMRLPEWKLLTQFLALSGLRIGEAMALTDADVDLEERYIHVTKNYSLVTYSVDSTKTATSTRDVFIQDELYDVIKDVMNFKQMRVKMFGHPSPHLFATVDGARISYDAYRKYLGETSYRVTGRRLTPHSLRHTHVALLAESGIGLDAISRRLGHSDSQITREVYFHVTERMREKENEEIKGVTLLYKSYMTVLKKA